MRTLAVVFLELVRMGVNPMSSSVEPVENVVGRFLRQRLGLIDT
jgi:hypothetical protein